MRLASFFRFKDKIPLVLQSNIVYKFVCGICNLPISVKLVTILKLELVNTQVPHLYRTNGPNQKK